MYHYLMEYRGFPLVLLLLLQKAFNILGFVAKPSQPHLLEIAAQCIEKLFEQYIMYTNGLCLV